MAATVVTLIDVQDALESGHYQQAYQQLQAVLRTNPTADAWYLAAELTLDKDREQAVRHLKRALLLNPRHGRSLTLLGELGETKDITIHDVAEEITEAVGQQADHTPFLRRLSRTQQMIVISLAAMALTVAVVWLLSVIFQPTGPAYIPDSPPAAAAETRLFKAQSTFNQFKIGGITMYNVNETLHTYKATLNFSVASASGGVEPVTVIVYDSVSDFIHDQNTRQQLQSSFEFIAAGNVFMAYSSGLRNQPVEDELIHLFEVITGM